MAGASPAPDLDYAEGVPIFWTHDFNIGEGKPMSSVLCQRGKVRDDPADPKKSRDVLRVLDEIILDGTDTHDAVSEFRNRRPGQRDVIIYGAAAAAPATPAARPPTIRSSPTPDSPARTSPAPIPPAASATTR